MELGSTVKERRGSKQLKKRASLRACNTGVCQSIDPS
jgi:hypothetical protein